jgi:hypothetical protein
MNDRTSRRPSLEKSWDAFYEIVCDFLRQDSKVGDWLRELHVRAQPLTPDPSFWRNWFPDHHAVHLLKAANPLDSLGVLLAVRLPPPQVFRFAFPWPWSEFRARRTLSATPDGQPTDWLPDAQIIRHIHTQMNFSFGDFRPEVKDELPLYNSMMRAAFESGAPVHCWDVFKKLATDEPETYLLKGPGGEVLFRSVEGQAQRTFGLRTVVYVPCKYKSRDETARGFCLALYSPIPGLFGEHQDSFEILDEPAWVGSLRANTVLERLYDALVECDRTARFTTFVILNSLYQNNRRRAEVAAESVTRILASSGVQEQVLSGVSQALDEFVHDSHIAAFEFLTQLPDATELSVMDVNTVLSDLKRSYESRPDFRLEVKNPLSASAAAPLAASKRITTSPMAQRLKILLQAFVDNASSYAVKVDAKTSAELRLEQTGSDRWVIEVSNAVEYPHTLEEAASLERYWWIRDALAPPGPRSAGIQSGGIQLFLIVCLCRGNGLEPELIMDVPGASAEQTLWRSRVSFTMR